MANERESTQDLSDLSDASDSAARFTSLIGPKETPGKTKQNARPGVISALASLPVSKEGDSDAESGEIGDDSSQDADFRRNQTNWSPLVEDVTNESSAVFEDVPTKDVVPKEKHNHKDKDNDGNTKKHKKKKKTKHKHEHHDDDDRDPAKDKSKSHKKKKVKKHRHSEKQSEKKISRSKSASVEGASHRQKRAPAPEGERSARKHKRRERSRDRSRSPQRNHHENEVVPPRKRHDSSRSRSEYDPSELLKQSKHNQHGEDLSSQSKHRSRHSSGDRPTTKRRTSSKGNHTHHTHEHKSSKSRRERHHHTSQSPSRKRRKHRSRDKSGTRKRHATQPNADDAQSNLGAAQMDIGETHASLDDVLFLCKLVSPSHEHDAISCGEDTEPVDLSEKEALPDRTESVMVHDMPGDRVDISSDTDHDVDDVDTQQDPSIPQSPFNDIDFSYEAMPISPESPNSIIVNDADSDGAVDNGKDSLGDDQGLDVEPISEPDAVDEDFVECNEDIIVDEELHVDEEAAVQEGTMDGEDLRITTVSREPEDDEVSSPEEDVVPIIQTVTRVEQKPTASPLMAAKDDLFDDIFESEEQKVTSKDEFASLVAEKQDSIVYSPSHPTSMPPSPVSPVPVQNDVDVTPAEEEPARHMAALKPPASAKYDYAAVALPKRRVEKLPFMMDSDDSDIEYQLEKSAAEKLKSSFGNQYQADAPKPRETIPLLFDSVPAKEVDAAKDDVIAASTNAESNHTSVVYNPDQDDDMVLSPVNDGFGSTLMDIEEDPVPSAAPLLSPFKEIMKKKLKKHAAKAHSTNKGKEAKLVNFLVRQARVEEEMKTHLKPFFRTRQITKEEYKGILKKAVPQVTMSSSPVIPDKIRSLMKKYVCKAIGQRNAFS